MQYRNRNDKCAKKPVGYIDVTGFTLRDGAEEHDGVEHPDHGDQQVYGPLQFGVLLAGGQTQWQGDDGPHDNQLPAPECDSSQFVGDEPRLAGALYDIVGRGKQGAAAKREDYRVGVQRAQPAEVQPGHTGIQFGPG